MSHEEIPGPTHGKHPAPARPESSRPTPAPTAEKPPAAYSHPPSSWTPKDAGDGEEAESKRWLLPYADFITLLMVLFMTLYALQLVKEKDVAIKQLESGTPQVAEQDNQMDEVLATLRAFRDSGQIKLAQDARGVEIAVNSKLLFHSGDARLLPDAYPVLQQIAAVLNTYPNQHILVEGHTDSQPISNAKYESNWELSSARAGAVVRHLVDQGVPPFRLSAMGRADNVPAAIGNDPISMAANRRVSILLVFDPQMRKPAKSPATTGERAEE